MKSTRSPVKKTIGSQISNHHHNNDNSQQQKQTQRAKDNNNPAVATVANTICDICVQNVPGPEREKIFAIGKCDHHSCYVCSARLRAICDQLECPICREKLDNVVFTSNMNKPYEKFSLKELLYNEKYQIYFENESIQNAFDKLLKFECLLCNKSDATKNNNTNKDNSTANNNDKPARPSGRRSGRNQDTNESKEFPDVEGLKLHLAIVHKLKLCDLCLTHNKLFPFEYSYYDLMSLRRHMRDGEPNTSHRGHPNCSLCNNTFFNQDDLIQHMSREHFHCHLCGRRDSHMAIYFSNYESLRLHFKKKHFLCERGTCRHEQFTSAFDSEIELQMHIVNAHGPSGANMSRGESRQQRTITLVTAPHRPSAASARQNNLPRDAAVVTTGTTATANNPRQQVPESIMAQIRQQRLPSRAEFPTLGGDPHSTNSMSISFGTQIVSQPSNRNHYPSLAQTSGQSTATISQRLTAGPSHPRGSFVRSAGGGFRPPPDQLNEMEFPPLPEQPKPKGSKKPKANQQNQKTRARDEIMTLDQLISSSLSITSRNNNNNRNKANKSNKQSKPKALKITL